MSSSAVPRGPGCVLRGKGTWGKSWPSLPLVRCLIVECRAGGKDSGESSRLKAGKADAGLAAVGSLGVKRMALGNGSVARV